MNRRLFHNELLIAFLHGLQRTWFAVSKVPVVLSFTLALVLYQVGQFHELYISLAEQLHSGIKDGITNRLDLLATTGIQASIALMVLVAISAMILISNSKLGGHRIEQVYYDFDTRLIDRRLAGWVDAVGNFAATLPWIGLLAGIKEALEKADRHISSVFCASSTLPAPSKVDCAANYFDDLQVASVVFDDRFQQQIKSWLGYLGWLPDFSWLVVIAGAVFFLWSLVKAGVLSRLRSRRFRKCQITLTRIPRTKRDRRGDRFLHARLVDFPYLARSTGDFIIAAVAFITLANMLVPFVIEQIYVIQKRTALGSTMSSWLPNWTGWQTLFESLKPYGLKWLMPATGLRFSILLMLWLALLLFVSIKRLPRRHPAWIEAPANIVLTGSGISMVWLLTGIWQLPGFVSALLLFCGALLYVAGSEHERERRLRRLFLVSAIASGMLLVATTVSVLMEFEWVRIARSAGPLAVSLLLALVVMSIIIGMCHIGRHTGVPLVIVMVLVGLAVVANKLEWSILWRLSGMMVFVAIAIALLAARRRAAGFLTLVVAAVYLAGQFRLDPEKATAPVKELPKINAAFKEWLTQRFAQQLASPESKSGKRYPVFIIAAEGGGIYAAAAAAAFMARLQERCPSFAQHVFAISGVSGGAVGSVVFQTAVDASHPDLMQGGCIREAGRSAGLQSRIARVIKDDHLSPLTGLVVSDILGTFSDRSWGLKESLQLSMQEHLQIDPDHASWKKPFSDHWNAKRPAPALIFNTTWVRVGNRVVFSPFEFDDQSLVTLSTFSGLQKKLKWCSPVHEVSATAAATTSARFPGVLGAYETRKSCEPSPWIWSKPKNVDDRRWSFVDGGYIDASGAQTAQEIYSSIEKFVKDEQLQEHVDLRLILLTDAQEIKEEQGTYGAELRDLTAPMVTLFSVRRLLSRVAVREAIARIAPGTVDTVSSLSHGAQLPTGAPWKVMAIELNHDDVQLELGWKLSSLTYDIVSLQLGQADLCDKAKDEALKPREASMAPDPAAMKDPAVAMRQNAIGVAKTIRANSCVMASIEKLL